MRKIKEKRIGSIWNPVNLQKEVHAFGYDFYWKTYLFLIFCMLCLIIAVSMIFKMKIGYIAAVSGVALGLFPVLVVNMYKRMYEQKRFSDVVDYMEQALYSFEKEHKILKTLKECQQAFPAGRMKQAICSAVDYIENGVVKEEGNLYAEAFSFIEQQYFCERLHSVHKLLISAEERGGEMERSAALLIEDIEVWKRQVYELQRNKKAYHMDCILSIVMAAFVCGLDMYIMNSVKDMAYAGEDAAVFLLLPVQISSFAFMLLCLFAFYKSSRKLSEDWIESKRGQEKTIFRSYHYVMCYDEMKEKRKSLLSGGFIFLIGFVCYAKLSKSLSVIFFAAGCFFLVQHKFSYNMSRKEVEKALYGMFAVWIMDLALLLQTNNVQVSIAKSAMMASDILRKEIDALLVRITENPQDVRAYMAFCEKFNVPEIGTCMKMLYSMSASGTGNAGEQIANLVAHVHKMQEKEAGFLNEEIGFKMRLICLYPVAATSVKLLVDMLAGTLLIFSLFQTAL